MLRETSHRELQKMNLGRYSLEKYYEGEMVGTNLNTIINAIASSADVVTDMRCCIVFGYGSQTSSVYKDIKRMQGVELIWDANFGPWWMTPLLLIAASHGGMIRILEKEAITKVFSQLSNRAMVELYSFKAYLFPEVEMHVRRNTWKSRVSEVIDADSSCFCFGVDGDSPNAESRLYGWGSFGKQCPESLKSIFEAQVQE